jgi:hypothetical protein
MANRKITAMTALTAPAESDVLPIVDVSEAAATDKNKKITVQELFKGAPSGTESAPGIAFESDDGNGIYLAGTDNVAISTGGSQRISVTNTGTTITGNLTVQGATTSISSTTINVDDKNIELGAVDTPTDTTANLGGITLKGATDKTINWVQSTGYWTFNTGIEVGGHLQIDDNNEIRIGDGQDLKLLHNASNSFIVAQGTGDLFIRNTTADQDIVLTSDDASDGNADYVRCDGSEGKVRLYHYGTQKFETNTDGATVNGTGSLTLPVGTTAQRPSSAAEGMIRRNTTDSAFEGYTGTSWAPLGGGATGGGSDAWVVETDQTVTTSYELGSGKHGTTVSPTINSGATITVPSGAILVIL